MSSCKKYHIFVALLEGYKFYLQYRAYKMTSERKRNVSEKRMIYVENT